MVEQQTKSMNEGLFLILLAIFVPVWAGFMSPLELVIMMALSLGLITIGIKSMIGPNLSPGCLVPLVVTALRMGGLLRFTKEIQPSSNSFA